MSPGQLKVGMRAARQGRDRYAEARGKESPDTGRIGCRRMRFAGDAGVDEIEREERILTIVNALAIEAMELPRPERGVFIRRRIVEVGDTLTQVYASSPKAA